MRMESWGERRHRMNRRLASDIAIAFVMLDRSDRATIERYVALRYTQAGRDAIGV